METPVSQPRAWQDVAQEAQRHREESIRRVWPIVPNLTATLPNDVSQIPQMHLSPEELSITETLPEILVGALATRKYTATAVVTAYLRRAGLSQALTNCVTELLPERALERARFLDEYISRHGRPVGPLHGLPVSVKEHISMKDLGLNAGFVSWWDHKGLDDAVVLQVLWRAGCVFYVRTTQPQTLMHLETSSNFYGPTVNPFNRTLTSGGSSGGEGALLGLRGSCLGLGTDIGGSVRSPVANCGVYSLRPTALRMPHDGCVDAAGGQEQILGTVGPMSTSLGGLRLLMKSILDAKPWKLEPSLIPMPWRQEQQGSQYSEAKKLKVAVMWHDGVVRPHPPVTRGLHEIVSKLKTLPWVDIVDWSPFQHDKAWEIISALYFPDGGAADAEVIAASGEPWLPLSKWITTDSPHVHDMSKQDLWQRISQRDAYRTAYSEHWNGTATETDPVTCDLHGTVDVILCPVGPGVAPKLGTAKYWSYTSQWNLLDYPALVFPVSKVDLEKDVKPPRPEPLSDKDEENWALYGSPKEFEGAPVSLQLVARRFEDEKVLDIAEQIQEAIGLPFVSFP